MELEDRIYALMMDALDGEISAEDQAELDAHLEARPSYLAEYQAMQTIDTLFRQTPALTPAADFTQRTMERLPNRAVRIWLISAIYMSLLVSGILPILLGLWVFNQLGDVLAGPAIVQVALQILTEGYQIATAVTRAIMSAAGELIVQQPMILGWLLVLGGIASLWGGLYRQLLSSSPRQVSA